MTMTGWIVLAVIAGFVVYLIKRMNRAESTSTAVDSVPEKTEDTSSSATVDTPVVLADVAPAESVSQPSVEPAKKPAAKKAPAKRKPAAKKAGSKKS